MRGGDRGGRIDGEHHKQLLVTVEVSPFLMLGSHGTATRIVMVNS